MWIFSTVSAIFFKKRKKMLAGVEVLFRFTYLILFHGPGKGGWQRWSHDISCHIWWRWCKIFGNLLYAYYINFYMWEWFIARLWTYGIFMFFLQPLPTKLVLQKKKAKEGRSGDEIEHFPVPSRITVSRTAHGGMMEHGESSSMHVRLVLPLWLLAWHLGIQQII